LPVLRAHGLRSLAADVERRLAAIR
jgi:hypothetical protein